MQKLLIIISLLLYWVGCGSVSKSHKTLSSSTQDRQLQTQSKDSSQIKADYTIDHVDISEISSLFVEGVALDVSLSQWGDFIYMATGSEGLSVIDVSNPYEPIVVGNYDALEYVNHVEVIEDIAYVTYVAKTWDDYKSISAFNVADPYKVKYLGYFEGYKSNDHKLYSKNGLVYYIDDKGFKVLREKDYTVIGSYDLFDSAYAFVMKDNLAYIANGRNGLTILKVGEKSFDSTLTNP